MGTAIPGGFCHQDKDRLVKKKPLRPSASLASKSISTREKAWSRSSYAHGPNPGLSKMELKSPDFSELRFELCARTDSAIRKSGPSRIVKLASTYAFGCWICRGKDFVGGRAKRHTRLSVLPDIEGPLGQAKRPFRNCEKTAILPAV